MIAKYLLLFSILSIKLFGLFVVVAYFLISIIIVWLLIYDRMKINTQMNEFKL